jgi:hypothetical protein
MKRFMTKKVLVVGVAVALVLGIGGAAFAYFTSTGTGTGSAPVATVSPLVINQIGGVPVYNSIIDGSAYQWSFAYNATGANDFGNEIILTKANQLLTDVTVAMGNFNSATDPSKGSLPVTLTIYKAGSGGLPGAFIGSDTVDVIPPATSTGYESTLPAPYGIANFNVTFDFTSQYLTLPSDVVYGISYDNSTVDTGLNVNLSYENPSVGSDTYPGYLYVSTGNGSDDSVGGPTGEITCSDVSSTFAQYSTASGNSGACGLAATPGPSNQIPGANLIPAVEFDATGVSDLYPGGPSVPINFSVTNPGAASAEVQTVTIKIAYDSNGNIETTANDPSTAVDGCSASWFEINGSYPSATLTLDQNLLPGTALSWVGAASISMPADSVDNQNACQGKNVGLLFSSN